MKKKLRFVSFLLVVVALAFLLINNAYKEKETDATDSESYTVSFVNGNKDAGEVVISIKENDEYIDQEGTSINVNDGTKVKIYFKNGLNNGYEIYRWFSETNGYFQEIYASSESKEPYQDIKFVKTVKKNLSIYVFAKTETDHVLSFYDSVVESQRSLVGLEIVKDGEYADLTHVYPPKRDGFDFVRWVGLDGKVTSDLVLTPTYDSNVWTVFRDFYKMFFKGLGVTLLLSVISVFCALFLGCAICLMRLSKFKVIKFLSGAYVEIIRGVPLLLQLLLIYVLLGPTRISVGTFFTTEVISCILTLFINSSAYTSEIFRSGVQAVDPGQMEAGRALGMSKWSVMMKIVFPQGIKNSLPSIGNELIMIIKETSLAVSVDASIGELMSVRKNITGATYINLPAFIIVAMIYFCVTFSLSKLVGLIEKRLSKRD